MRGKGGVNYFRVAAKIAQSKVKACKRKRGSTFRDVCMASMRLVDPVYEL
jgi:hypothetical protein